MKVLITILVFVIAVSGIAFNLTTKSGKFYKDCEILTVTDEKITIAHESGSAAVAISDLPDNVKSRIQYRIDAYKAKNVINVNTAQETSNKTVAPAAASVVKVAEAPAAASQPVAPVAKVEAPAAASQPVVPADASVVKIAETSTAAASQPEVPSQYSYRATEISEKQFNKLWNMFKGALYLDTTTGILQEINCPGSIPKVSNYIRIMSLPEFKQYLNNGGVLYFLVKQPVQGNDEHVKIKRSVQGQGNDEYIKQEIEITKIMDYNVVLGIQQETGHLKYSYCGAEISEQQFNKLWDMFKGALYFVKKTGSLLEIKRPNSTIGYSNQISAMSQPELKKYLDNGGSLYFWVKGHGNWGYIKHEIEIARIMNYNVTLGIQQENKSDPEKYSYRGTEISEKQLACFKSPVDTFHVTGHEMTSIF